jgi:hypothetical protein
MINTYYLIVTAYIKVITVPHRHHWMPKRRINLLGIIRCGKCFDNVPDFLLDEAHGLCLSIAMLERNIFVC